MYYYEVLPKNIVRLDKSTFVYESDSKLPVGLLVSVPVGNKNLIGVIVAKVNKPDFKTKQIAEALDNLQIPLQLIKLTQWISTYYSTHPSTTLSLVLPSGLNKQRRKPKKDPFHTSKEVRTNFLLNADQKHIVDKLTLQDSGSALLQGITGSGKTAVYIELAKRSVASGKSVIVLLPEIALTSQILTSFSNEFTKIYVFHSRLSESEKSHIWSDIAQSNEPCIIIGARSALFLPVKKIGLIVVDESHEPSYKQDRSPKYSALRVAGILGKLHNSLVIFGSATPSVVERFIAESGGHPVYKLDTKARKNTKKSKVTIVDMRDSSSHSKHPYISSQLIDSINSSLENKMQSLIYHNRRGSRNITLCEKCGWSALCDRCFIPMTLHSDNHTLRCHACTKSIKVPSACPQCLEPEIIHKGIGTKQIESDLRKLFPYASIARFDGDNSKADSLDKRFEEVVSGKIDILIGTQILAKGLDLPKLETVGVIQAESGLALPDYQSSERTFQLLAQVAGRIGRNEKESRLIIQTYQPSSESIVYGSSQDYESFYLSEIQKRHKSNFPPFCYMLLLTCGFKTEETAVRNAKKVMHELRPKCRALKIEMHGPEPAFYERAGGLYRWQILLKSGKRSSIQEILKSVPARNWYFDIDPSSLI